MGDCGRYYDEGLETSASLAPYDGNLTLFISHFPTNTYSTTVFLETKPASFLQTQCESGVFGSIVFWFFVYRQMHQLPVCPPVVYEWKPLGILDGCKENANLLKFHSFQNNKFSEKRSFSFGKYSSQCHFSVAFKKYSKLHICLGE